MTNSVILGTWESPILVAYFFPNISLKHQKIKSGKSPLLVNKVSFFDYGDLVRYLNKLNDRNIMIT